MKQIMCYWYYSEAQYKIKKFFGDYELNKILGVPFTECTPIIKEDTENTVLIASALCESSTHLNVEFPDTNKIVKWIKKPMQ